MTSFDATATPPAVRRPRTDEEIAAITRHQGEEIWIQNLEKEGDHDLVDALFEYRSQYDLNHIATAFLYVRETHGEYKSAYLTTDLLDKVQAISSSLYALISNSLCGKWYPDEYRELIRYFVPNFDEWGIALGLIEARQISKHYRLMELLPQAVEGSSKALLDGTL